MFGLGLVFFPLGAKAQDVKLPLRVEYSSYMGWSNREGLSRFSDGFWAGTGTAYPSTVGFVWEPDKGVAAKVAVGTGSYYNGSLADQPAEAWVSIPVGSVRVKAGKFWTSFAAQEWEYETKPGVALSWSANSTDVSIAGHYDDRTRRNNFYGRVGQSLGSNAYAGLSYAWGRGLSFGSNHNRGWGIDAGVELGAWSLVGELLNLDDSGKSRFRFGFAKLGFDGMGRFHPYLSHYSWSDSGGFFGESNSLVYGLNIELTRFLTIEAAIAPTSSGLTRWVQLHWGYKF